MRFQPSELIISDSNRIYHLGISPEQIGTKIIIVGDQARVPVVSSFFSKIIAKTSNREFSCHTGIYENKIISVVSTGIGTGNIDIVLNELDALVNIDFQTRRIKENFTQLEIIRIGTCGILQDDIPIDSFILSDFAMGLDNLGHFYQSNQSQVETILLQNIIQRNNFPKFVQPYLTQSDRSLFTRLNRPDIYTGITVTAPGFYGPQGRKLRQQLVVENLIEQLSAYSFEGKKFTNLEMECSALFNLSKNLGHQFCAICLGLANRKKKEFSSNYDSKIKELILHVLSVI
jgi:uridine phosphorylase